MVAINYVWDELSDNVISEVDDSGNTTAEYTNEPSLYGELISQRRDSADSYFHFDSQRSTRQLTTDDETETDNYSYSAFGEPVASSGTTANPFRFVGGAGYYTDIEIGEIYVRARKYRPTVGRWLSMDPMVFIDGPNRYVYVNNDPSNFVDPRGTFINIELKTSRDSHCWGRIPFAEWDFSHEPRPCFGYFVQKVELECSGGDCFCDAQVHKKVLYEAWSVEPHKSKWSGHGGLRHHFTDRFALEQVEECGFKSAHGEVRFYCIEDTGFLGWQFPGDGMHDIPPSEQGWKIEGTIHYGNCKTSTNLPTYNGDIATPHFWTLDPVDGPATHWATLDWNCCECRWLGFGFDFEPK